MEYDLLAITGNIILLVLSLIALVSVCRMPKENYVLLANRAVTMFAGVGVWLVIDKIYKL
jgi:hypothetical protein